MMHRPAETGRSWAHWQQNSAVAKVSKPISYADLINKTDMTLLPFLKAHAQQQ